MRIGVNIDLKWYGMVRYGMVLVVVVVVVVVFFFAVIVLGVHGIYAANYPT